MLKKTNIFFIFIVSLVFYSLSCNAENLPLAFYTGNYNIIGKEAITGKPYTGIATIEVTKDKKLKITQKIGANKPVDLTATFRKASPGEGMVMIAKWPKPSDLYMACLTSIDLSNYPRITCLWGAKNTPHKQLGLQALFPTGRS